MNLISLPIQNIPTDTITVQCSCAAHAPKAFMISLLQLMAQHENELKKDGCLTNEGEIEIFTNPDHPDEKGLSLKWLDLLF